MSWFKKLLLLIFLGITPSTFATVVPLNDEFVFWPNNNTESFNTYETDLFRFDYAPDLSVREKNGITFLVENASNQSVWQIFEPEKNIKYLAAEYQCFFHTKRNKSICLKTLENPNWIQNLVIFPRTKKQETERLHFFQSQGFLLNYDPRGFFTRAEMVALAARLRYPKRNFDTFRQRCFLDVPVNHPYAGEICWAKENKVVMGIGRNFYPTASINVWGILKILGKTFGKPWENPDMNKVPSPFLEKMHPEHIATPMLLRAWELGILKNKEYQSLWANRSVRQEEILQIVSDFLKLSRGFPIKTNHKIESAETPPKLFYDTQLDYLWKEKKNSKAKKRTTKRTIYLERIGGNLFQIWMNDDLNLYQSTGFITLDEKVQSIDAWFDFERIEGEIEIKLADERIKIYRPVLKPDLFQSFSTITTNISKTIKFLTEEKRSPKLVTIPDNTKIPIWDITLPEKSFEHFFKNSTRNKRYPSYLQMKYPNGETESYSVLLKARGNANRGYIKPSLTLESFSKFKENQSYYGDEFLNENKEVKLRSFINEETMIHEKLLYRSAQKIGLPAPDFFEVLVRINGIPFGLFQVTEPVKKPFFKTRNLPTSDYFYAQNINALFDTNLGYYDDDPKTLSAYKAKGNPQKLLTFIKQIESNDPALLQQIDIENVFNYAYLAWRSNAWDSLTHNYYVFWDREAEKWKIFPWDGDLSWENLPQDTSFDAFDKFGGNTAGSYNKLIHYLFTNLPYKQKIELWNAVQKKWEAQPLIDLAEEYRVNLKPYFEYDNRLWNGRFLEREKSVFDTDTAILKLERTFLNP